MNRAVVRKKVNKILALLLAQMILTGCSASALDKESFLEKETEQTFDYEVPESKPSILVNQLGYYTESVKTAIFVGQTIPESFSVIDAKTKEEVYIGKIEHKGYQQDAETNVGIGAFTEFTKEGEYYLLCDTIGQSYHFEISDNIYDTLLTDLLKGINQNRWKKKNGEIQQNYQADENNTLEISGGWYTYQDEDKKVRSVKTGCETLVNLLMSVEYYVEEHSDAVGIEESGNEIPDILDEAAYEALWLLKMQDGKSGAVYGGVTERGNKVWLEKTDMETCQYFIIAMAKFSNAMKKYDSKFATECLRASDAAWKYVENIRNSKKEEDKEKQAEIKDDLRFYGAAELYRASGGYKYHAAVKEFVPDTEDETKWSKEVYLGIYTYLGTRLGVSKSICEEWMKQIMDKGEEIAARSKKSSMTALTIKDGDTCQELLWEMTVMTSVDYIIANHEYDTILENNLHYILGRNKNAYSYIRNYGNDEPINREKLSISDDMTQTSAIIYMLSEIISNQS